MKTNANRLALSGLVALLALPILTACNNRATNVTQEGSGASVEIETTPPPSSEVDPGPPDTKPPEPAALPVQEDPAPTAESVYPDPAFTLTAAELSAAYAADRTAWRKNYHYKVVELTGTVKGYSSNSHTGFVVKLVGEPDKVEVILDEETPWVRYPPGSTITLRGKSKSAGGIEIGDAMVIKSQEGEPLPEYTAGQLAELVAEEQFPDQPGLGRGQWLRLKSTVTKTADDENRIVYLGADGEDQLEIWIEGDDNYDHRQCRNLKPGDEVVFLGDYNGTGNALPSLKPAFLVSPLPDLPAEPTMENRLNEDGVARPHLIFSADLLGEWHAADPRALERMVDRRSKYAHVEVKGEVLKTSPSELDEDDVYVYFKNARQADVRCIVETKFRELDRLTPGTSITILGVFNANDDFAYITDPEVVIR